MIPVSNARFINHSCSPNCIVNDDLTVVTIRSVRCNEDLTISYNIVDKNEDPGLWNQRWTFKCLCGAKNCQDFIDKYVNPNGTPWNSNNHKNFINKYNSALSL